MQRHRLRGGHRVGINPNSSSNQPLHSGPNSSSYQPLHSGQLWNRQDQNITSYSFYQNQQRPDLGPDSSWNWGSSNAAEEQHKGATEYGNYSHFEPNTNSSNLQNQYMPSVVQPLQTYDQNYYKNENYSNAESFSTGNIPVTTNSNKSVTSTLPPLQGHSDEWGWNDDNWEEWRTGEKGSSNNNIYSATLSGSGVEVTTASIAGFKPHPKVGSFEYVDTSERFSQQAQADPNQQLYFGNGCNQQQHIEIAETNLRYAEDGIDNQLNLGTDGVASSEQGGEIVPSASNLSSFKSQQYNEVIDSEPFVGEENVDDKQALVKLGKNNNDEWTWEDEQGGTETYPVENLEEGQGEAELDTHLELCNANLVQQTPPNSPVGFNKHHSAYEESLNYRYSDAGVFDQGCVSNVEGDICHQNDTTNEFDEWQREGFLGQNVMYKERDDDHARVLCPPQGINNKENKYLPSTAESRTFEMKTLDGSQPEVVSTSQALPSLRFQIRPNNQEIQNIHGNTHQYFKEEESCNDFPGRTEPVGIDKPPVSDNYSYYEQGEMFSAPLDDTPAMYPNVELDINEIYNRGSEETQEEHHCSGNDMPTEEPFHAETNNDQSRVNQPVDSNDGFLQSTDDQLLISGIRQMNITNPLPPSSSVSMSGLQLLPVGPSGNISNLQAREGSLFQPPSFQKFKNEKSPLQPSNVPQNAERKASQGFAPNDNGIRLSEVHSAPDNDVNFEMASGFNLPLEYDNYRPDMHMHQSETQLIHNESSSGIADSSQDSIPDEENSCNEMPEDFHRMIPGESHREYSKAYQPPVTVPEMPSDRVVTGNDNPQPLPVSRLKQEPTEIRSPPDGPDTASHIVHQSSNVVPPIRSETIGSEDMVARPPLRNGRRSDRRDRDMWEGSFCPDDNRYYEERKGGHYKGKYNPPVYDRSFNTSFDRRYRRDIDEGDDGEMYSDIRARSNRGYVPDVDHYNDYPGHRKGKTERDYHLQHEMQESFSENRFTRSHPSSPSSSDGNPDYCERPHHRNREMYTRDRDREFRSKDILRDRERDRERNSASAREYHKKDRRAAYPRVSGYPHPEQYGSREMFDMQSYYNYYYYQKYYEQHPYYRDFYRNYYRSKGFPGAWGESLADEKGSRSGRSSINDEMKKSSMSSMAPYDPYGASCYGVLAQLDTPSHFQQGFLDQSLVGAFRPSSLYDERASLDAPLRSYPSGEISALHSMTDETGSDLQQRVTPPLFRGPHISASFAAGGKMVMILPSDPRKNGIQKVEIESIQQLLSADRQVQCAVKKMSSYPGPLTVNDTHKDVVIRFCEEKAMLALNEEKLVDRSSVVLLWEYLSLLVKQNGKLCGADLANLLLKGKDEDFPAEEHPQSAFRDSSDDIVKIFMEYLCLGKKKEAVDYAIKEGLWGYALVLSAKMDPATHTRVIAAFTQLPSCTHLFQTLFQHMSGKRPDVSKNYSSDRWGDWRLHLAMMVSNPTAHPDRDRASILALGDTLAARNCLHAAQLCYLAGDADWGSYEDKESKLVLLGASPQRPFSEFATEDAIRCTEVYEFAKSLNNSYPIISYFHKYKLIYAYRLCYYGFPNESLKLLNLSLQLKYNDVHYKICEGEISEMQDPEWLLGLQHVYYSVRNALQQSQIEATSPQVAKEEHGEETYMGDVANPSYTSVPDDQVESTSLPQEISEKLENNYDGTLLTELPKEVASPDSRKESGPHMDTVNSPPSVWQQEPQTPEWQSNDSQQRPLWQSPQHSLSEIPSPHNRCDVTDSGSPPAMPSSLGSVQAMTRTPEEEEYWAMMSGKGYNREIRRLVDRNGVAMRKVTFDPCLLVRSGHSMRKEHSLMLHQQNDWSQHSGPPLRTSTGSTGSLVFGGSFPIDSPISARRLGTDATSAPLKTYQVDAICCAPPHVCADHEPRKYSSSSAKCKALPVMAVGNSCCGNSEDQTQSNISHTAEVSHIDNEAYRSEGDASPSNLSDVCEDSDSNLEENQYDEFGGDKYVYDYDNESVDSDQDFETGCYSSRLRNSSSPVSLPSTAALKSNYEICPQKPETTVPGVASVENVDGHKLKRSLGIGAKMKTQATEALDARSIPTPPAIAKKEEPLEKMKEEPKLGDEKVDDKKVGFLGSIFGGWRKNHNPVNLPDDKNPSIVWDEKKRKWVSTDGTEPDDNPPPPPPSAPLTSAGVRSFRSSLKSPRYLDPVGKRDQSAPAKANLTPPLPNMSTLHLASKESQQPIVNPSQSLPASSIPDEIRRNRFLSKSSSVDLTEDPPKVPEDVDNSGSVPMMAVTENQGLFNPIQMMSMQAINPQPKRSGPSKRIFNQQ